jgi:hypothetical protein
MKGFCGHDVDSTVDTEMEMFGAPFAMTHCVVDEQERGFKPFEPETVWEASSLYIGFSTKGIFGLGTDPVHGSYIIRGELDVKNMVAKFAKQFIGKHTVVYTGRMNVTGEDIIIKGRWFSKKEEIQGFFKVQGRFGDNKVSDIQEIADIPYLPLDERGVGIMKQSEQGDDSEDSQLADQSPPDASLVAESDLPSGVDVTPTKEAEMPLAGRTDTDDNLEIEEILVKSEVEDM